MKRLVVLYFIGLFPVAGSFAQLQKIQPGTAGGSQSFSVNFEKVVQAYRTNFHSIQGDPVPSDNEKVVFKSKLTVPGSLHAMIYRFQSRQDSSASWQAVLYTGEDQKAALKSYKQLCRQVNRMRVGGIGIFKGDYEAPDPNLRFAGSVFKLETEDDVYRNFYAEVDLLMNADEEWEVHLNLVRKKDDQDMY